jgi:hypothetical protein
LILVLLLQTLNWCFSFSFFKPHFEIGDSRLFTFSYSALCYPAKYFSFSCDSWFSFYNDWWVKRNCKVFSGFERFSNPLSFIKPFLVLLLSWIREIRWLLISVLQHLFGYSWQWYLFCSVKVILVVSGEVILLLLFLLILLLQFCEHYCLVNIHLFKFKCLFFIFIRLISTILLWGNIIYHYAKQCIRCTS